MHKLLLLMNANTSTQDMVVVTSSIKIGAFSFTNSSFKGYDTIKLC